MYEDKSKRFSINIKSVIIKMAILLVVVFLVLWLISIIKNRGTNNKFDFKTNLNLMKDAATEYFTESRLPVTINGKRKITLQEMYDDKLLIEFANSNTCNLNDSYAEATKINSTDYTIKVKLVCEGDTDYIINELKVQNNNQDNNLDETQDNELDVNTNDNTNDNDFTINPDENNTDNSTDIDNNITDNNQNNNSSSNSKPNTVTKPNNSSSSSNTNNSSSKVVKVSNINTNANGTISLNVGESKAITATVSPSNATNKTIKWSSANSNIAKVNNGVITGKNAGTTTISISAGNITKTFTVKVNSNATSNATSKPSGSNNTLHQDTSYTNTLQNIINNEYKKLYSEVSELSRKTGLDLRISISSTCENNCTVNDRVTFRVLQNLVFKNRVVYEYYLDQNGNRVVSIDTRNNLIGGSITTSTNASSSSSSSSSSNSNTVNVSSVTLNKNALTLATGDIATISATVNPSNATNKTITWSSSNTSVATVSNGKVTAKKAGTATITASAGGKKATVKVTVNPKTVNVSSITIHMSSLTLNEGESYTISATVNPSNATNKTITWSSSNTSVATVSNGKVTAKKAGTATITASAGGKKATVKVTVNPKTSTDNKKVYSLTYYLLARISSSDVGKNYTEEILFENLIYTANIKKVTVTYFNSGDFNTYYNNSDAKVGFRGKNIVPKSTFKSASDIKKYALTSKNYKIQSATILAKDKDLYGNTIHSVSINTTVNNVSNVSKYNGYYYVPYKITVQYTL